MENSTQDGANTLAAFCQKHGIGKSTAYDEIRAGRLKAVKVGSRTIITSEAQRAWRESLPALQLRA